MIFSKRERLIITAALVVVSLLVFDRYVLTPLLQGYSAAKTEKDELLAAIESDKNLLTLRRRVDPKWRRMLGGLKYDPAEAETQMLHALGEWSEEAGLNISLLRPERLADKDKTDLREITFFVAGNGSMESVSRFLWRLETGDVPARLKTVQLRSRKEKIDDLSLQLRVSTLYMAAQKPSGVERSAEVASKGGGE